MSGMRNYMYFLDFYQADELDRCHNKPFQYVNYPTFKNL